MHMHSGHQATWGLLVGPPSPGPRLLTSDHMFAESSCDSGLQAQQNMQLSFARLARLPHEIRRLLLGAGRNALPGCQTLPIPVGPFMVHVLLAAMLQRHQSSWWTLQPPPGCLQHF